ncbi:hypothetical protein ACTFIU_006359 [Dictyostelium citrinum]
MQQQQPKVKLSKKDYLEKKEKEQQLLNNNANNKANREKDGKVMIEKNLQEKQDDILMNEKKKQQSGLGIDKTFTLVMNTLGHLEKKNDIDQYWVLNSKEHYLSFITFLPADNNEQGSSEESILFMNSDLSSLLKFKYNIFWSHCIYNKSFNDFIDSFLKFFKRDNQPIISLVNNNNNNNVNSNNNNSNNKKGSKDFNESKKLLFKRVFLILVRMSLQQEKAGFITRDFYSELIYKNKLFTIPKLFDIVSLYSSHARDAVTTMIQSIFDTQPNYYKDLLQHFQLISKTLFELNQSLLNRNLLDLLRLEDNYLMDIVYNLEQFIRIFPMGSHPLFDECLMNLDLSGDGNGGVLGWLTYFYEYIIPIFNRENQKASNKQVNLTPSIYIPLKQHILSIFHTIFRHHFMIKLEQLQFLIQDPCQLCKKLPLDEISHRFFSLLGHITSFSQQIIGSTKNNRSKLFNEYFDNITSASILYDYEQTFKLSNFLEKLVTLDSSIDFTSYTYFMQLIGKPVTQDQKQIQKPKFKKSTIDSSSPSSSSPTTTTTTVKPILSNNPVIMNTVKIDQVKSLFPDLGDWFVHCCLKYYNQDVEQVINALCDDSSLPPHLKSMDRSLSSDPSQPTKNIPTTTTTTTTTTDVKPTTTTTTTTTTSSSKSLEQSMNELNISIGQKPKNDIGMEKVKAYIKSYEKIYDDEYDDSLEEFSSFSVQDGEKYNDDDEEEKKDGEINKNTEDQKQQTTNLSGRTPNESNNRPRQNNPNKAIPQGRKEDNRNNKQQTHSSHQHHQQPQQPHQNQQPQPHQNPQQPQQNPQPQQQQSKPQQSKQHTQHPQQRSKQQQSSQPQQQSSQPQQQSSQPQQQPSQPPQPQLQPQQPQQPQPSQAKQSKKLQNDDKPKSDKKPKGGYSKGGAIGGGR